MIERKQYDELPTIIIDPFEITITGRSIPEDADLAYFPFIKKLEIICKGTGPLTFNFKFDYYNTASTRYITAIIKLLDEKKIHSSVKVNWYYLEIDEDMQDLGIDYKEMYPNLKIKLIKRK